MERTDAELVRATLNGETRLYGVLVGRYAGSVYARIYRWTQNRHEAEDLTQEAFARSYEKLKQLRQPERYAAWLIGIVLNLCRMWARRQSVERLLVGAVDEDMAVAGGQGRQGQPSHALEDKEIRTAVSEALNLLSPKLSSAATLYHLHGLSYREVAELLSVPITTVEARLHKARRKLRELLVGDGPATHPKALISRSARIYSRPKVCE